MRRFVRSLPLFAVAAGVWTSVAPPSAHAAPQAGSRVKAGVDWALHPGDALGVTEAERRYGEEAARLDDVEPFWQGGMLFTKDSMGAESLGQVGLPPLPAMNYESAPGILFLALDGVTLQPNCGNGDSANSALNCSPLVDNETAFPPYGSDQQSAALFAQLQEYYEPFNLVLSTARPPDWVPYTMAVVGGSASQAGQPGGVCGVANVACDGLKRNHVSLTFPQSCGGTAATAAQETSHNWGLEHTDNQTDLLYPFNSGGGFKTFVDDCMTISHATGDGVTQCGYIHEIHCAAGDGEQQNSFQELLGVFGPRAPDTTPPVILDVFPLDGATYGNEDTFTVTAHVSEDSNFLAAKWTLDGGGESVTRCTNNVCDSDYNVGVGFDPNELDWDFVTLTGAPAGDYELTFEVMDAYGQYTSESITITVVEGETPEDPTDSGGETDSSSDSDSDSDSGPSSDTDVSGGTGSASESDSVGSTGEASDGGSDDDDDSDDDESGDTDPGLGGDDPSGCGCVAQRPVSGPLTLSVFGLALLGLGRRRRRAG